MCGIYGEFRREPNPGKTAAFGNSARIALEHRGPDGSGTWSDSSCLLGHTRLAIIDLTDNAAQPMASATGKTRVAFNGEIYNYVELRSTLSPPGGWRSTSDTEVLVEAIENTGPDAVRSFVGMFAVACWRPDDRELWLIRDRLGKKPLYYAIMPDGSLRFASELGALLADGELPRATTFDRIAEFLQHGYVAAPRTGIEGVSVLPPGCWLRAKELGNRIVTQVTRYWDLPVGTDGFRSASEWHEAFGETLKDAVRIRLRSDVPLGAFLSGGVDSSVVSLLASEQMTRPLQTFTVDFAESNFSEGKFAAEVAQHIGAIHTRVELTNESLTTLPNLIATYGDLHGDSSALPTLELCRAARKHLTVALSGDGGDEVLGGYARYASALKTFAATRHVPEPFFEVTRDWVRRFVPPWLRGASRLARLSSDFNSLYAFSLRSYWNAWPTVLVRPADSGWHDAIEDALRGEAHRTPLLRMMACDARTYLPEDILVKVDRASMAAGLEVRAPFLDHRLIELSMRAEMSWLWEARHGKLPLRKLYASRLPGNVFQRPKMGFGVPLIRWLRQSPEDVAAQLLATDSALAPLLDRRAVGRLLNSHRLRVSDESARIWHLLVLQGWIKHWGVAIS